MRKLLQSFLAVTAVLTLAPSAALALPPQCFDSCDFQYSECDQLCAAGSRVTTCGQWGGVCAGISDPVPETTVSVTKDTSQQSDASSQVCGEAQRDAEPSAES